VEKAAGESDRQPDTVPSVAYGLQVQGLLYRDSWRTPYETSKAYDPSCTHIAVPDNNK